MKYFSKSTNGFYDSEIHMQSQIPEDAQAITQEEYEFIMSAQSEGKIIVSNVGGKPIIGDYVPDEEEQLKFLKKAAQILLNKSDVTIARCYENNIPVPEDWKQFRADLRTILNSDEIVALPNRPNYPAGT